MPLGGAAPNYRQRHDAENAAVAAEWRFLEDWMTLDELKDLQQREQELIQAEERLRRSNERRELVLQRLSKVTDLNKKLAMHKIRHDQLDSETKDLAYDAFLERIRQLESGALAKESGKNLSSEILKEREKHFKQLQEIWVADKQLLQQRVESQTADIHNLKAEADESRRTIEQLKGAIRISEERRANDRESAALKRDHALEQARSRRDNDERRWEGRRSNWRHERSRLSNQVRSYKQRATLRKRRLETLVPLQQNVDKLTLSKIRLEDELKTTKAELATANASRKIAEDSTEIHAKERDQAVRASEHAEMERVAASKARLKAEQDRDTETVARKKAERDRDKATADCKGAERQRDTATTAHEEAESARNKAVLELESARKEHNAAVEQTRLQHHAELGAATEECGRATANAELERKRAQNAEQARQQAEHACENAIREREDAVRERDSARDVASSRGQMLINSIALRRTLTARLARTDGLLAVYEALSQSQLSTSVAIRTKLQARLVRTEGLLCLLEWITDRNEARKRELKSMIRTSDQNTRRAMAVGDELWADINAHAAICPMLLGQ